MPNIELYKVRIENKEGGKAFYPHTSTDVVFDNQGQNVEDRLKKLESGSSSGGTLENLLINGNLKLWLRGDNLSINSSTWTYTAEMFRCKGTGTVSKVDNGLKVTGATNIQYKMELLDFETIKGKQVTLSYMKNNVLTKSTFTANSQIVFNINLVANDILNWVALCVGEKAIETQHPENMAETKLKCSRYCLRLNNYWERRISEGWSKIYFPIGEMRVAPTIVGDFQQISLGGDILTSRIDKSMVFSQITQIAIGLPNTYTDSYIKTIPDTIIVDAQDYS